MPNLSALKIASDGDGEVYHFAAAKCDRLLYCLGREHADSVWVTENGQSIHQGTIDYFTKPKTMPCEKIQDARRNIPG